MTDTTRHLPDRLDNPLRSSILSWESLLVVVAIAIFIVNSFASPYFLNEWSLSDLTFNFTEKALIALAMALLIVGEAMALALPSPLRGGVGGGGMSQDNHAPPMTSRRTPHPQPLPSRGREARTRP